MLRKGKHDGRSGIRAGGGRGLAHPGARATDSAQTISSGNPDAKPEKAIGLDGYFEWYMQPRGYLSFGVYYKDLKGVLFTQSVFGRDILNTGGVDRSRYTLTTLLNRGNGRLLGAEASIAQSLETYLGGRAFQTG